MGRNDNADDKNDRTPWWRDPSVLLPLAGGGISLWEGSRAQGRADDLMARQLAFDEARWQFGEPLRNMALQGLPQMFSPIDMGNHMYDSANPYAAARGPRASNATFSPLGAMGAPNFAGPTRADGTPIIGGGRGLETPPGGAPRYGPDKTTPGQGSGYGPTIDDRRRRYEPLGRRY